MNASELFPPSEYLKSEDIDNAGGELDLVISSVGRKEYEENGKIDVKGVITFSNSKKKLTCNATNTLILINMFGSETDDWIGKQITLYVDEHVKFQGKETRGIRVRLVDSKQDAITEYWIKVKSLGYDREYGLKHLAEHNNDFVVSLKSLA